MTWRGRRPLLASPAVPALLARLPVTTLTIRNFPDDLKARLRMTAAAHGRSMEEEVRNILREVLSAKPARARGLGARIHARFAELGGVELAPVAREDTPRAPDFKD